MLKFVGFVVTLNILHFSAISKAAEENIVSIPLNHSMTRIPLQLFEDKPFAFTITHPPKICSYRGLPYGIDVAFGEDCRFRLEWNTWRGRLDKIQLVRRWDKGVCVSLPMVEPITDVTIIMLRDRVGLADDNSCEKGYCDYDTCVVGDRCPLADPEKLKGTVVMTVELSEFELTRTTCNWTLELNNSTGESLVGEPWFSNGQYEDTLEAEALLKSALSTPVSSSESILSSIVTTWVLLGVMSFVLLCAMICLVSVFHCCGPTDIEEED